MKRIPLPGTAGFEARRRELRHGRSALRAPRVLPLFGGRDLEELDVLAGVVRRRRQRLEGGNIAPAARRLRLPHNLGRLEAVILAGIFIVRGGWFSDLMRPTWPN